MHGFLQRVVLCHILLLLAFACLALSFPHYLSFSVPCLLTPFCSVSSPPLSRFYLSCGSSFLFSLSLSILILHVRVCCFTCTSVYQYVYLQLPQKGLLLPHCNYACMHVCMCACMYVCDACMYVCMYACIFVCMYACMHLCM